MAHLEKYLNEHRIVTGMKAQRKVEAIREVASTLEEAPEIPNFREFLSAVIQKESRFGTGVGHGVAIPHYRDDTVRGPAVSVGISREGIDWGEADLVHILVLIGWPHRRDQAYLKMVSEVANLLRRDAVRRQLLEADTPGEVLEVLSGQRMDKAEVAC
jgi:mannitol/fructose-specific phosphotransferase system IIA component (Ntr-type)